MTSVSESIGESRGDRISAALAARRAKGLRLGRRRQCPDAVLHLVVSLKVRGAGPTEIARILNSRGELTPAGSDHWYPSHVCRLLQTQDARRLIEGTGELSA